MVYRYTIGKFYKLTEFLHFSIFLCFDGWDKTLKSQRMPSLRPRSHLEWREGTTQNTLLCTFPSDTTVPPPFIPDINSDGRTASYNYSEVEALFTIFRGSGEVIRPFLRFMRRLERVSPSISTAGTMVAGDAILLGLYIRN